MKTSNKILMLCIIAATAFFASCKKDKKTTTPTPTTSTKTDYLTKGPWKLTAGRYNTNGGAWIDYYSMMSSCDLDNTATYFHDFTEVDDEGATKCNAADPQSTTSHWAFNTGETSLIYIDGVDSTSYIIQTLNDNTLKLQASIQTGVDVMNLEVTFGH